MTKRTKTSKPADVTRKPRYDLAKQIEQFGADSLLPDWKPPAKPVTNAADSRSLLPAVEM